MRLLVVLLVVVVLPAQAARASAWTLDRGGLQVLSAVTASRATRSFDNDGRPGDAVVFNKLLVQNWMEYGITDAVTLFAAPEYVMAETDIGYSNLSRIQSASFEAGLRVLLLSRIGMLSLQASGKSAGAFGMSVSASGQYGRQVELRLLYGRSFKLFRRDVFLDLQAAQRWIQRPRPNELLIDATAGLWFTKDYLVMIQSFNTISHGVTGSLYQQYRLHKLQASLVQRITRRWSVQGGYFFALAGQNIVQEQGVSAVLWYRV